MALFDFSFDLNVSLEQRIGFEMAAAIWSSFLSDDVTINLHIGAVETLGENGQAVGGAVPIFHETHYGVYQEYLEQDASSNEDAQVINALQTGNSVDVLVDGQVVDGNTNIMLTRAQAKALGMEDPLLLDNGSTWDRDVVQNSNDLDGYILINNTYNWHYDPTRAADAPEGTLDFLTMALHEVGHALGFVSGLDGLIDTFTLHSGEQRTEGFTALDLMRYSETSAQVENSDGSVSDLSFGSSAYFSIDGGQTSLAEFEEGDQYQASHWQRFRNALGIMDPTLGYQERTDISHLDLTAFDAIGWDINYDALAHGLDLETLYEDVLKTVGGDSEAVIAVLTQGEDWQALGAEAWFDAFKEEVLGQGWGTWFQGYDSSILEQGWGTWFQEFKTQMLEQGWGTWFQDLEAQMLEQVWGTWFQDLEAQMLEQGWGTWFQVFEEQLLQQLWGTWFQSFEEQLLNQLWGTWFQDFEAQVLEQGWGTWFQNFEQQILEQGWGTWFQNFEGDMLAQNWGTWFQQLDVQTLNQNWGTWFQDFDAQVLEQGWGTWFQQFESQMLEQGWGTWFQENEAQLLEQGWGTWFQRIDNHLLQQGWGTWFQKFESQVLEQGWGTWFQELDSFLSNLDSQTNNDELLDFTQVLTQGHAEIGLVQGNNQDDIIGGTQEQDRIAGKQGEDLIDGNAGDDVLWGDEGNDILYGHAGNDVVYGGKDDDFILGESGNDQLLGESGADIISGGDGHDVVSGGSGRDNLEGGNGLDLLAGGKGDDWLKGGGNDDLLAGNQGQDRLQGGWGNDVIYGDRSLADSQAGWVALLQQFLNSRVDSLEGSAATQSLTFSSQGSSNGIIRTELEEMLLHRFNILHSGNASGDALIETWQDETGTATTEFTGDAGRYMIFLNYLDESDGQSTVTVKVNGIELETWKFDQDNDQFISRSISTDISLNQGDTIEILGNKDGAERILIDYIDFVPLDNLLPTYVEENDPATESSTTQQASLLNNSGFESGYSSWELYSGTTILSSDAYTGDTALSISADNSHLGQIVEVITGETYTFSAIAKSEGHHWSSVGISFMDSHGQELGVHQLTIEGSDWQTYSQSVIAPENAQHASVWAYKSGESGTLTLDELSLFSDSVSSASSPTTQTTGNPLLLNGDFESELGTDWKVYNGHAETVQSDTSSGQALSLSDSVTVHQGNISVSAGKTYELSAFAKYTGEDWGGFGIGFWDINGQQIITNSFQVTEEDWSQYQVQAIAPENAYFSSVWISNDSGNGQLLIDDVMLSEVDPQTSLSSVQQNSSTVGNGLLAHWSFNEAAGLNTVDAINGFNGAFSTLAEDAWVPGKEGTALSLEDTNSLVAVSDAPQLRLGDNNTDFSVAFWINPQGEANGDWRTILGKWSDQGDRFGVWMDTNSNRLKYSLSTTVNDNLGHFSQNELEIGQWSHVTYVKEGDQVSLYLNGQFDSSITLLGEVQAPDGLMEIGGGVNGHLDDLRFYNRALTLNDVMSLSQYGADIIEGGSGQDFLYGDEGDDQLYGESQSHFDDSVTSRSTAGIFQGEETLIANHQDNMLLDEGTLAFSFQADNTATDQTLFSKDSLMYDDGGHLTVRLLGNGRLQARLQSVDESHYIQSDVLNFGQSYDVALTFGSRGLELWVDGQLESTRSYTGGLGSTSGGLGNYEPIVLGASQAHSNDLVADNLKQYFSGTLENVRLLDQQLSSEFIAQLPVMAAGANTVFEAFVANPINNDVLIGGQGHDSLNGNAGDDILYGDEATTSAGRTESGGNDWLIGNVGNDILYGEVGDDVLNGTSEQAAGVFERDILTGGQGADRFVLGDSNQAYYLGHGNLDYALIKDFNPLEDIIQLNGSATSYGLQQQGSDTYLVQSSNADVVAIFRDNPSVNFGSGFAFV